MAGQKRTRAMQGGKPSKRAKTSDGTLVTTQRGGTQTHVMITPKVPKAIATVKNNSAVVKIANTEVWAGSWPVQTGTFGATGTYLNPISFLAWGANIAINFSKYRFTKLRFRYVPIVGTTQTGYFAMAFVSDPEDATSVDTFTVENSLARMANSRRYVQVPAWEEAVLDIKPGDFSSPWYLIEASSITDQATARQTVAGGLIQAAQSTGTAATGIIYIDYEMELMDPVNAAVNR